MSQADESITPIPEHWQSERRRRLEAISDPRWIEIIAELNLKPMIVHMPINRDRPKFAVR